MEFTNEISNYTRFGTYNYRFDEVGNEILNPSSSIFQEVYFSFPLLPVNYDKTKILSFYNPDFVEFVKPEENISKTEENLDNIKQALIEMENEKILLQNQLDELIAKSQLSSVEAKENLIKDIIIELRIQLGQGKIPADFDTVFPYLPLPPEEQPSNQT